MQFPTINRKSIRDLISEVSTNRIILPALQREYVWREDDIEKLFDSLMQGFPINTMMFWDLQNISNQPIDFYQFLHPNYIQGTFNQTFPKNTASDHLVVIDGQQRITSLYIALCGSYQGRNARQAKELYLRLDSNSDALARDMKYDFQFLTQSQLTARTNKQQLWIKVKEVFNPSFSALSYMKSVSFASPENEAAANTTISELVALFTNNDAINYYQIKSQSIDDVLDTFVRTNNGGIPLSKGDLLLSAMTVNWLSIDPTANAREYIEDIISDVRRNYGYKINKDWVMECCLLMVGASPKLKVQNFLAGTTSKNIFLNKNEIRESISKAFELIRSWHLLDGALTTKLAIIPIVKFIFSNGLSGVSISNTTFQNNKDDMRKYLFRAILKNLYRAGTDATLTTLCKIVSQKAFSYQDIVQAYPELKVTNADIDNMLETRKAEALPILNIIYELGYCSNMGCHKVNTTDTYDVDHLHPKKQFSDLSEVQFTTPNDSTLANDGVTFDTLPNLELLSSSDNRSKNKKELTVWLRTQQPSDVARIQAENMFAGLPTDIENFDTFIQGREAKLRAILQLLK